MPTELPKMGMEQAPSVEVAEEMKEQEVETEGRMAENPAIEAETESERMAAAAVIQPLPTGASAAIQKDDVTIEVERIMEEGLSSLYATLPEKARPLFKKKGEEAATEIAGMVRSLKVNVGKVLRLLRDWLLTIPHVNRFFLEQEAKIKTDNIVELAESRHNEPT